MANPASASSGLRAITAPSRVEAEVEVLSRAASGSRPDRGCSSGATTSAPRSCQRLACAASASPRACRSPAPFLGLGPRLLLRPHVRAARGPVRDLLLPPVERFSGLFDVFARSVEFFCDGVDGCLTLRVAFFGRYAAARFIEVLVPVRVEPVGKLVGPDLAPEVVGLHSEDARPVRPD